MSTHTTPSIIGEPEVVEDASLVVTSPAWAHLKRAASEFRELQVSDGSVPAEGTARAGDLVRDIVSGIRALAPAFPHDAAYLDAVVADFEKWADGGFGVPDFLDSLLEFQPAGERVNGRRHLVVFPMYTQNGSPDRLVEAVLIEVVWPDFVAELEAGDFSNKLFVPIRFLDFTGGYDTNAAVLFPETVATRETPTFTWGAIFCDREAARFRRVVRAASEITGLELPEDALALLDDQHLAERTFVMWDLIHDRTHMRGDLPFDPFMVKQRMPFFLYGLEELRCDLTAFREAVRLVRDPETDEVTRQHAKLVQYAVIFDRIFRFAITGTRVRNYDGFAGQLLFAWMHQNHVLHWTNNTLSIDWDDVPDVVNALGERIGDLYWRSIDRPKVAHWLAAYELATSVLEPNPASQWARGLSDEVLAGAPRGYVDALLDDEFPLSMFYEALQKKMAGVIESTAGITGASD